VCPCAAASTAAQHGSPPRCAGISDGYWEYRLKPWDTCAGVLIAQEAGAAVTTMEGEPFSVFERSVVAAAPGVHEVSRTAVFISCG
jgi:fructose-1,6-bisphosphatase/inositol monophosphatase family enzyme